LPADVDWEFWTADGRRVVGRRADTLVSRGADGGPVEPVGTIAAGVGRLWAISPDGKFALGRVAGRTAWAAVTGMASPGSWAPLTDIDENQVDASFSPDGRFVLYAADTGIYVQPFPGPGRRQLVDKKGIDPVWRGDGKEIAYVQGDAVWSAAVSTSGGTLTLGTPQRLFAGLRRAPASVAQSQSLAVSRDGTRLYFVQGVEQPAGDLIHVMIKR
jgi:Tol biopolymer transport system component